MAATRDVGRDGARIGPPAPPPISLLRRAVRLASRLYPFLAWCGALAMAGWLYAGESGLGHLLATAEVRVVRVVLPVDGRIATLDTELGQAVLEGEVIATLDRREIDAELQLARARLERARTQVAAQSEVFRSDFEDRRGRAEERRTAHLSEGRRQRMAIEQLAAADATDRAELASVEPRIERLTSLRERKLVTADQLEDLVQDRAVLAEGIASRTERLRCAREELAAWEKLAPEVLAEPDFSARLLPIRSQVEAEEANVSELEIRGERHRLVAGASGTVGRIAARPGEWCAAGTEIVEIVVPCPGRATAYLTGRQISTVAVGDRAWLRPRDHLGPALRGRVAMVGPRIELVPPALRTTASVVERGQLIAIDLEGQGPAIPGEIFNLRFP